MTEQKTQEQDQNRPDEEIVRLAEPTVRGRIVDRFRELGFAFVSLDLEGFRSGSLNVLVPEAVRESATRLD